MKKNIALRHGIILIVFSAAIFLPELGNGFVHDDFLHLYTSGFHSFWDGFRCLSSGAFLTPLANLSFQMDWILWGGTHSFLIGLDNLVLHIATILLLYALSFRIWQSHYVALWTAFGFSLLFPSNTWAILWIATRAHILVAFFYILTLYFVLCLARSERHKAAWITAVLAGTVCTIFSKENGLTILLSVLILLFYLKKFRLKKKITFSDYALAGMILLVFIGYYFVRVKSGAIAISFDQQGWYSYSTHWKVLSENLLRYGWRTYGLLFIVALAHFLKGYFQGLRPRPGFISKSEIFIPIMLSVFALAPFLLMRGRSGIYSYLAGAFAALLLGAVLHSFEKSAPEIRQKGSYFAWVPILIIFIVYTAFNHGYSSRWVTMKKTNTSVLNQIHTALPDCDTHTYIVLYYAKMDRIHRFPEGLAWGFPYALRILYRDPTLDALLVKNGDPLPPVKNRPMVCFDSKAESGGIRIAKITCNP